MQESWHCWQVLGVEMSEESSYNKQPANAQHTHKVVHAHDSIHKQLQSNTSHAQVREEELDEEAMQQVEERKTRMLQVRVRVS